MYCYEPRIAMVKLAVQVDDHFFISDRIHRSHCYESIDNRLSDWGMHLYVPLLLNLTHSFPTSSSQFYRTFKKKLKKKVNLAEE